MTNTLTNQAENEIILMPAKVEAAPDLVDVSLSTSTPTAALDALAELIRKEHQEVSQSYRRGLEHARKAGDLLQQAKKQADHGTWLPWLRQHCGLTERTAQLYIRVAKHWPQIESKTKRISDLTINQAVKLVSNKLPNKAMGKPTSQLLEVAPSAPLTEVTARVADAPSVSEFAHPEEQTNLQTSWAVTPPNDEQDTLRQRIVALEESVGQVLSTPILCDIWTESSRNALVEQLHELQAKRADRRCAPLTTSHPRP